MGNTAAQRVLRHVRNMVAVHDGEQMTDRELLRRFADGRDEAAFAALVRRHGPMVLGLCRRVLSNPHDAEDAFQAAFFTLARKAGARTWRASVGPWLHQVAWRLALRLRAAAARRCRTESQAVARPPDDPLAAVTGRELYSVLDAELNALPERLRAPLVLCCLEGQTRDEAARQMGCSVATLKRRLEQGRELLRIRLQSRGFVLPAILTGLLAAEAAQASLPAGLVQQVAAAASAGVPASARIAALSQEIARNALATKTKAVALLLAMCAALGVGVGFRPSDVGHRPDEGVTPTADSRQPKADLHGDPLPEGAVLRLGTLERRAVGAKLALSADGKSIIGVRAGKYVHVWDAATGKLRQKRELSIDDPWWRFWLSDDGRWLATEHYTGITIWDVQTGKKARQLAVKGRGFVDPVVFSADFKMVAAVVHSDGQTKHYVHAWNLADGKEILAKEIHVTSGHGVLAFSPDGKRLLAAISSQEQGMHCWDIATGNELWREKEFVPQAMMFMPDGNILSTQEGYNVVDAATGKRLPSDKVPPLDWYMRPKLTPDGRTLLISTKDDVIVWDMVNGKEIRTLKGDRKQIRTLTQLGGEFLVAPDGKSIIMNDGALQRWDLATGQPLWADNYDAGHVDEVTSLVLSADGKRLASASADGTVRLWDMTSGKALNVWRGHEFRRHSLDYRSEKAGVTALDMTPDGRWVLSAGSEGKLHLHDTGTGKQVHVIALPAPERGEAELRVFHIRITLDGAKAVALFGAEGYYHSTGDPPLPKFTYKLVTWDLKTGAIADRRPVEILPSRSSAFSPDGRTFLAGGVLTDVKTGCEIAKLEGAIQGGSNDPAVFSPDGTLIVGVFTTVTKKDGQTFHSPGGVRVWETATGKTVAHLKTKSWVGQVAIHPNNRFVITNDYDGIQVWDAITGKVVAVRQMHERVHSSTTSGSFASCLAFTPAGRLATGHPDSTVLLWDVPLPRATPQPLAAKELETLWTDLTDADAAKAWRAVWRLSDVPSDALPMLRERLKPVLPAPTDRLRALLADLEDESFERRQQAVKHLKELGPRAGPALRQALEANPTAETKRRIQEALAALETPGPLAAEALRESRAIVALERIGSREAREVLAALAKGPTDARLTREAKAAAARLANP